MEKCVTAQVSKNEIIMGINDRIKFLLREAIMTILSVFFKENLSESKSVEGPGTDPHFPMISDVKVKTHFAHSLCA